MAPDENDNNDRPNSRMFNNSENIKVAVRLRPLTEKEKQRNNRRVVDIEEQTVVLFSPKAGDLSLKKFTFDHSYWSHDGYKRDNNGVNVPDLDHPNGNKYVGQEQVFQDLGVFLLANALEGYNSALLAYGQTGSGKSYTVTGYGKNEGILPRFAKALFDEIEKKKSTDTSSTDKQKFERRKSNADITEVRYDVYFSMIEIYNEVVRDLLAKSKGDLLSQSSIRKCLKVREHPKQGFFVENLTSYLCASNQEIQNRIEEGQLNKSIAATSMNETSSRGHTIYEFKIKHYKIKGSDESVTTSTVQLVDLAGSERLAVHVLGKKLPNITDRLNSPLPKSLDKQRAGTDIRSAHSGSATQISSLPHPTNSLKRSGPNNVSLYVDREQQQRFKESISINQSLSALGNCIQVLSQYSQANDNQTKKIAAKIPYRDSVLTKLLNRCCLSGNSKVVIIATLSPTDSSYDETLCTLRFADRAKQIQTHAIINRTMQNEMVDSLQRENARLRKVVDGRITRSDDSSQTSNFDDNENMFENFTGSRFSHSSRDLSRKSNVSMRGRTTVKKSRDDNSKASGGKDRLRARSQLPNSSSNPSLAMQDHMKRLVSPASKKLNEASQIIYKSRSVAQGLSYQHAGSSRDDELDLRALNVNYDDDEIVDVRDDLLSPEESDEELSDDEKIGMINKLLSNTKVTRPKDNHDIGGSEVNEGTIKSRPKKANQNRTGISQITKMSTSLKRTNPYLSNLNQDEQLTGVISYIIKNGTTIIGKDSDCDIVLHGTELRGHHARILRRQIFTEGQAEPPTKSQIKEDGSRSHPPYEVHIEPLYTDSPGSLDLNEQADSALMVNGSQIIDRVKLNHCDRVLFGTNAFFVFVDNQNATEASADTLADLDMVSFDMARNEVLRKFMVEKKNRDMMKEIQDYNHRPGTGKNRHRSAKGDSIKRSSISKLARSMTIQDNDSVPAEKSIVRTENPLTHQEESARDEIPEIAGEDDDNKSLGEEYREQLIEDTYEYAMPLAEVNAVAKELEIKVSYKLKILTSEEQIFRQIMKPYSDASTSDGASSIGELREFYRGDDTNGSVTYADNLEDLDAPPSLHIEVHLEEWDIKFYWSKEKFQARRFKILEIYGAWDIGQRAGLVEHLIEQSKIEGEYLIDPFVDDPKCTPVLIGHIQISLKPISHLIDIDQHYEIINLDDQTTGVMSIQAVPCYPEECHDENGTVYFRTYSDVDLEKNMIDDPKRLLNESLVFMLKIESCDNIPDRFTNIFCQYHLGGSRPVVTTKLMRDSSSNDNSPPTGVSSLKFDHSRFIAFKRVTQDVLDFLEHGFLTIQVIGLHRLPNDPKARNPTLISTIIASINKYKDRIGYQNPSNESHYTDSSFYDTSNPESARSERYHGKSMININSGASSAASTSASMNLFDHQNDQDDTANLMNDLSQENLIDMILIKRKLDRAENQLLYLKRTVNIAEHYNKKQIPVKTVKKLLNSYGQELGSDSVTEAVAEGKFLKSD